MSDESATPTVEPPAVRPKRAPQDRRKTKRQPPYHVILWNDEDHSYEYVIMMMRKIFGHVAEKGMLIAMEVDARGRAIVMTTTRELAELKRDQIHAYGRDDLIDGCVGSMWASIEPAPGD
jgi:ATP-dependent Clp protease adaptor protein ClpS